MNLCDSEIRSTSTAIASTAASILSSLPLMVLNSRGGTGRGSSHLVIRRTIGKPRTIATTPGTRKEKTVWTIRFGSGCIILPEGRQRSLFAEKAAVAHSRT